MESHVLKKDEKVVKVGKVSRSLVDRVEDFELAIPEKTLNKLIDLIDSRIKEEGKVKKIEVELNNEDFIKRIANIVTKKVQELLADNSQTSKYIVLDTQSLIGQINSEID